MIREAYYPNAGQQSTPSLYDRQSAHPSDYTLHLVIYFVTTFLIHPTEIFYKVFLQIRGKRKGIIALSDKFFNADGRILSPNSLNMAFWIGKLSFAGKHVSYTSLETNDIKTETAHQTVFRIRYQFPYLFGSSSQSD